MILKFLPSSLIFFRQKTKKVTRQPEDENYERMLRNEDSLV